jgi:predicted transcriptional regulator
MKKNNKSELLDNSKIGVSKEANKGSDFKQSLIDMFIEARDRLKADKRHLIGVKKAIKESEINYNEVNAYLINEQLKKAGIFGKDTKTTKVFTIKQGAKL